MPKATLSRQRETVAHPLTGAPADYDALLVLVGNVHFVLLGEASHGIHEFYHERARITQRLIQEKGCSAVAVEADWPDAYRVHRYVRGVSDDAESVEARARGTPPVGFYGLDLYSLNTSMAAVLDYLEKVDPEAARGVRYRYGCFEHFGEDTQAYGSGASIDLSKSCAEEVVSQLIELQRRAAAYAGRDGHVAPDEFVYAEQNARLVKNAEAYDRAMFRGRVSSWSLRDCHMAETLAARATSLQGQGQQAKIVVWAHNAHLGDAWAPEMGQAGELHVGQLVRERYGKDAVLIGFRTSSGTVTAATAWEGPAERKRGRPALPDSYEALFRALALGRFLLLFRKGEAAITPLRRPRLERAIGVIYRPETERLSPSFSAKLPEQFDAVLHFEETRAVEPREWTVAWERGEVPETFPPGL